MDIVKYLPLVLFTLATLKSIALKPSIEEVLGILVLGVVYLVHNLKLKKSKDEELLVKYVEIKEQYQKVRDEMDKHKEDILNTKSFINSMKMNRGIK